MTNAILRGKPDAGNPHVRFDEGEVASEKPRRGSLLYKRLMAVKALALCAAMAVGLAAEAATDTGMILYAAPEAKGLKDGSSPENATTVANAVATITVGSASAWNEVRLESGTADAPAVYDWSGFDGETVVSTDKDYLRIVSESPDRRAVVIRGGGSTSPGRAFRLKGGHQLLAGVTIEDFDKNVDVSSTESETYGGASAIWASSTAVISNCVIRHCIGKYTGAAAFGAWYDTDFIGCTNFTRNMAGEEWNGAAVAKPTTAVRCGFYQNHGPRGFVDGNSASSFYHCYFASNTATRGIYFPNLVTNCTFYANRCSLFVDGTIRKCRFIANQSSELAFSFANCPQIYDSVFERNDSSTLQDRGKCVRCVFRGNYGSNPLFGNGYVVTDCVISNNYLTAENGFIDGGGGTNASLVRCLIVSNRLGCALVTRGARAQQCVVVGNVLDSGANMCRAGTLEDCLIVSNALIGVSGSATIASTTTLEGRVRSCTIAHNRLGTGAAVSGAGASKTLHIENNILVGNGVDIVMPAGESLANSHVSNCVYGVLSGLLAPDFIAEDAGNRCVPGFRFKSNPDTLHPWGYAITSHSAARDAGKPLGATPTDTDLTGVVPRIVGNARDIGCYEYQPSTGLLLFVR